MEKLLLSHNISETIHSNIWNKDPHGTIQSDDSCKSALSVTIERKQYTKNIQTFIIVYATYAQTKLCPCN
jgi:hypothetical protein